MSKLLKMYNDLKKENSDIIYIFQVGIFYNILNEDAKIVSNEIGLKITNLSPDIIKCGFPISAINKYEGIFKEHNLNYKIVTNQAPPTQINADIIKQIKNIDLNNTTCIEAFNLLYNMQQKLKNTH